MIFKILGFPVVPLDAHNLVVTRDLTVAWSYGSDMDTSWHFWPPWRLWRHFVGGWFKEELGRQDANGGTT